MSRRRVVGTTGAFEYVIAIDEVSLLEDEPLYAARLVAVIDQATGVELPTPPAVPEAYAGTVDDAVAHVAARTDQALADF